MPRNDNDSYQLPPTNFNLENNRIFQISLGGNSGTIHFYGINEYSAYVNGFCTILYGICWLYVTQLVNLLALKNTVVRILYR